MNLLLEEDRTETSVESTETFVLEHLGHTTDQTIGIGRLRDETDTGSLKRAEGDIGEELSAGRRTKVDSGTVFSSGLITENVNGLLLEELVTTELESALEEVTGEGGTDTSEKGTSTFVLDDLAETTDQTTVVGSRVELNTGLDAVRRSIVSDVALL